MKLSIVIASHGSNKWRDLAQSRALPSAEAQGTHEVLIEHDPRGTRADVRNRLIERATGDWICTLDADDELAPEFVDAVAQTWRDRPVSVLGNPILCLFTPQVQYVHRGLRKDPKFWPEVDLRKGNWMVVGTVAPRALMLEVGGWRTFTGTGSLNEWDDWDMWIRCVRAGAQIVKVPEAVYVAHILRRSPHRTASPRQRRAWHEEIERANFSE